MKEGVCGNHASEDAVQNASQTCGAISLKIRISILALSEIASLLNNNRGRTFPKYIDGHVFSFENLVCGLLDPRKTPFFSDIIVYHEESSGNYPVPKVFKGRQCRLV